MAGRKLPLCLFFLSLLGLGLSAWLIFIHVRIHLDPTYVALCAVNDTLNCEKVATSTYAVFAGLPVAFYGAIAYLIMAYLAGLESFGRQQTLNIVLLSALGIAASLVSIVLEFVSLKFIDAVCLVCMAVHVVSVVFAILATWEVHRRGEILKVYRAAIKELRNDPWPLLFGALLAGVLLIAGPGRGFPRYWELASWKNGPQLPHGIDQDGHPWLGASSPKIEIHEYFNYGCPACRVSHLKLHRILSKHSSQLRVIRHDLPRMSCKRNRYTENNDSLCIETRAGFCAARLNRFWQWNDAVLAHPKPEFGKARNHYEITLADKLGFPLEDFERCLSGDEAFAYAQRVLQSSQRAGINVTPLYRVEDRILNLRQLVALIEERL